MRFQDIPQFTRSGSYTVNQRWRYLEHWIEDQQRDLGLVLEPEFQRAHVWTEDQQRKYVEYILRGGRSGKYVYFNCSSWQGKYNTPIVLVDGLQRITAVRKFMRNDLEIFGGCRIEDYTDSMPHNAELIITVNDLKTEKEVLTWYIEMNSGGTPHTDEEIEKVKQMLKKYEG